MRVISGKSKGKNIISPKDKSTRPLKDLTKESIFNILEHSNIFSVRIEKANILDVFAGVGSFGLECLSRGATNVTFCENYQNVIPILKKNVLNFGYTNQTQIIEKNIFNINEINFAKNKFDIIFFDPPYKIEQFTSLLDQFIKLKLLKKEGIFIIHRHKKQKDVYPKNFKIVDERIYGISKIIFGY
tara:strand:- start:2728 stop:3285 length:558 start_codon:yes stop_codon:yes gene_type:complete